MDGRLGCIGCIDFIDAVSTSGVCGGITAAAAAFVVDELRAGEECGGVRRLLISRFKLNPFNGVVGVDEAIAIGLRCDS
ncbi:hypothetical protein J3B02_001696 [Coemansia erecta]|nr:hypothetical protein J3B02_001696 [Coemansia erecta]